MAKQYECLAETVLTSGNASSVDITSIPQTYTHLKLVVSGRLASNDNYYNLRINGSTQTIEVKTLRGSGTVVASEAWASTYLGIAERNDSTGSTYASTEYYIPNYTSSNYKSISVDSVTENNATAAYAELAAGLWSSTSAITSIGISNINVPGNILQYTRISLYGIKNS